MIVGGLFPTLNPGYFAGVADAVVVGEAEPVMKRLLADLQRGRLSPVYRAEAPADLAELPVPRYDLVETDFKMTMPLRGHARLPVHLLLLRAVGDPRPVPAPAHPQRAARPARNPSGLELAAAEVRRVLGQQPRRGSPPTSASCAKRSSR